MSLIFLAGLFGMVGLLIGNDALLQSNVPLEVVGLGILIWRLRAHLAPAAWGGSVPGIMTRTAVVGLVLGVALLAYVVSLFVAETPFEDVVPWLVAMDHINFIMVMTNLIFAMMATASAVSDSANRLIFWGANTGVLGFAVGIFTENTALKRIFTPILGLALLYGIYTYLTAKEKRPMAAEVGV
jgi:predicted membrane protein